MYEYIIWLFLISGFSALELGAREPQFELEYGDSVTYWMEGESLFCDPSMEPSITHEVKNNVDTARRSIDVLSRVYLFHFVQNLLRIS